MEKVQTPFPALPSFNISASILAYSGYEDEAHILLHQLCRNTRLYSKSHSQILRSFLLVDYTKLIESCTKFKDSNPDVEKVDIIRIDNFEFTNDVAIARMLTSSPAWSQVQARLQKFPLSIQHRIEDYLK